MEKYFCNGPFCPLKLHFSNSLIYTECILRHKLMQSELGLKNVDTAVNYVHCLSSEEAINNVNNVQ